MSENLTPSVMNFDDLAPQEMPFVTKGKQYVLREATGGPVVRYRTAIAKGTKMEAIPGDKNSMRITGTDGFAEHELQLVADCVFERVENANEEHRKKFPEGYHFKAVPVQNVRAFPNRVLVWAFDNLKKISGINEGDDTPATIKKRIAEDQAKLADIEKAKADGGEVDTDPKEPPATTTAGSD